MHPKRVARLKRKIGRLRRVGGVHSSELARLAAQVGRRPHPRGKEPTWVSDLLPTAHPLSIPRHHTLNRFTVRSILDRLEEDLDLLSEETAKEDHEEG